jgi:hypothetical protein
MTVLNERYLNINEQIISSLFRVLHAIFKFLKHSGNELKEDFMHSSYLEHASGYFPSITCWGTCQPYQGQQTGFL